MNCPMCGELWDDVKCKNCGWKEPPRDTSPSVPQAQKENTDRALGSMATGNSQHHAPIARPVCSLHKTPKRAHYYCLQCVQAGEYEVNINSATNLSQHCSIGSHFSCLESRLCNCICHGPKQ